MLERIVSKTKSIERQRFSEEKFFSMLRGLNVASDHSFKLGNDAEMSSDNVNDNLEKAIGKVSSDCVDYLDTISSNLSQQKKEIQAYVLAGAGTVGMIFGMTKGQLDSLSCLLIAGAASVAAGSIILIENDSKAGGEEYRKYKKGVDDRARERVVNDLLALSLSQEYVDRHFSRIVRTLAKREKDIRKGEEMIRIEEERMRIERGRELQIREKRIELGLAEVSELGLEDLLQGKEGSNSKK